MVVLGGGADWWWCWLYILQSFLALSRLENYLSLLALSATLRADLRAALGKQSALMDIPRNVDIRVPVNFKCC